MSGDWRWSISRSRLLAECPRAFQLLVFSNEHQSQSESRYALSAIGGVAIHRAISAELDRWAVGKPISPLGAMHDVENFLASVWAERQSRFIEMANGDEASQDVIRQIRKAAVSRIQRFFQILWPQFSDFKHDEHEQLHEFALRDIEIAIRVDLACWNKEEQLCIIDWKTGGWENERATGAQLAVYTLWAHVSRGLPIGDIAPIMVGLESGRVVRFQPTYEDLDLLIGLIRDDRALVDHYSRTDGFPPAAEPKRCRGCRYLRICEEGKACTGLFG